MYCSAHAKMSFAESLHAPQVRAYERRSWWPVWASVDLYGVGWDSCIGFFLGTSH